MKCECGKPSLTGDEGAIIKICGPHLQMMVMTPKQLAESGPLIKTDAEIAAEKWQQKLERRQASARPSEGVRDRGDTK